MKNETTITELLDSLVVLSRALENENQLEVNRTIDNLNYVIEILKGVRSFRIADDIDVVLRDTEKNLWAVCVFSSSVLDEDLNRHYELMSYSRDDAFIELTRFPLIEALKIAKRYKERRNETLKMLIDNRKQ
jgi:hypothetical protein